MASFSWSDFAQACLPCLNLRPLQLPAAEDHNRQNQPGPYRIRRARPDELQGLLADTGTEGETLSLHSNVGDDRRRRRKKSKRSALPKTITIFGYDLFGRPAIQLPPDDEYDDGTAGGERRGRRRGNSLHDSDTLDSDAAPLDVSMIDTLSSSAPLPPDSPPERTPSEERRIRRQERKELKRAAAAAALAYAQEEFEGFPGSGSGFAAGNRYPNIPSPFKKPSRTNNSPSVSDDRELGRGTFAITQPGRAPPPRSGITQEDAEDDADLGGEFYTRRSSAGNTPSGSDSRSQTRSQSQSNASYTKAQPQPHPLPHVVPLPRSDESNYAVPLPTDAGDVPAPQKKKKKSKPSSKLSSPPTTATHSTTSSLSSNPLPPPLTPPPDTFSRPGFPSVGFSGKPRNMARDVGAFLARRGSNENLGDLGM
jgi:hypothetical protein